MLATEQLLQALSDADLTDKYKDCNDYDFGKVLELYVELDKADCGLMCPDGEIRNFLFNG